MYLAGMLIPLSISWPVLAAPNSIYTQSAKIISEYQSKLPCPAEQRLHQQSTEGDQLIFCKNNPTSKLKVSLIPEKNRFFITKLSNGKIVESSEWRNGVLFAELNPSQSKIVLYESGDDAMYIEGDVITVNKRCENMSNSEIPIFEIWPLRPEQIESYINHKTPASARS